MNNWINHGDEISKRNPSKITLASQLVFYRGEIILKYKYTEEEIKNQSSGRFCS